MKLKHHQAIMLVGAGFGVLPGAAQVTVSGEASEMPDLNACIAEAEKGDTAAVDACVNANLDEIKAFIAAHPETANKTNDEAESEKETSE